MPDPPERPRRERGAPTITANDCVAYLSSPFRSLAVSDSAPSGFSLPQRHTLLKYAEEGERAEFKRITLAATFAGFEAGKGGYGGLGAAWVGVSLSRWWTAPARRPSFCKNPLSDDYFRALLQSGPLGDDGCLYILQSSGRILPIQS